METLNRPLKKLNDHEVAVFCSQLSMLIKGGVAPFEAVSILLSDTKDKEGQRILNDMMMVINTGEKLHTAMEETQVFPDYCVHMVTIGEESGTLDTVLDALAAFYDREDALREMIRNALRYPLVMIGIMILVMFVLITRVMPVFAQVFAQLGTGMNAFSESLLELGTRLNRSSLLIVGVLCVFALLALFMIFAPAGKRMIARFAAWFPPTRKLHEEVAAGRFASGMALTLKSGMDTYQSLDLVGNLVDDRVVSEKILSAKALIREKGLTFPEALEKTAIFTQLYTRMVLVGFKSGSMDQSMQQIALHYEKETDRKIANIIAVIEPTLIILLSLIVGMILLSVILPLMGVMSSIG
ncbi:MAG: type II secretion system F family protein [Lachnospiraceae bacterium]|nr:type II secretion system F family protein [Lachnospiraceae bacterium]